MDKATKPLDAPLQITDASLKLSPQQFAKVLDALRGVEAAAGASDKRRFTRMTVEAKVGLASLVSGHVGRVYNGLTRDISVNGVGLIQGAPLERGESFLACLPLGKEEMIVRCKAAFCRRLAEGIFGIGAEFASLVNQTVIPPSATEQKPPAPPANSSAA